jgi:integrase
MNGSVKKRGATWYYKFRNPQINPATGKHSWITKGGFRTKAEASDAQRAAIEEAQQGKYVNPSDRTVAEYISEWLEFKKLNAGSTTVQGYTDEMNLYVLPRVGRLKLQKLDESRILQLYVELRNGGRIRPDNNRPMYEFWAAGVAAGEPPSPRAVTEACGTTIHAARAAVRRYKRGNVPEPKPPGLDSKTLRNIHAAIRTALEDAVALKYIKYNPAAAIKPPKLERKQRAVWTPAQTQAFLRAVSGDRLKALFLIELTTGMRRGHLCGLKWSNVDLDRGAITLSDSRIVLHGKPTDKRGGKTANADKTIAIDTRTVEALRRWRELQDTIRTLRGPDYEGGELIFTTEMGRPLNPQNLVDLVEKFAAAAGVPRITFHDLRHTYATAALEGGVAMKVVSERIGHSNVSFTMQTYAHVRAEADHEAAQQAADFLIGDAWEETGDVAPTELP